MAPTILILAACLAAPPAPTETSGETPVVREDAIMPPIDTSKWSVENIDEHVAKVRQLYLRALGQESQEKKPNGPA